MADGNGAARYAAARWCWALLAVGLCAAAWAQQVCAQPLPVDTLRTVGDCLQCHSVQADVSRFGIDPRQMYDAQREIDYRIDYAEFAQSNHRYLGCRICHIVGHETYPHAAAAKNNYIECLYCHRLEPKFERFDFPRIRDTFLNSIHYQRLSDRFTCFSCHSPHVFRITEPDKRVESIVADDNAICLGCHASARRYSALTDRAFPIIEQTHSWLPSTDLHWEAVRCVECHTPHTDRFSHTILSAEASEHNCVACHSTNSILLTTLYKFRAAESRQRYGLVNSVVLGDSYVIAMTRNVLLEALSVAIFGLTLAGIAGHGFLRWLVPRMRRRS